MFEKIEEALSILESFGGSAQEFYHQWWSGCQLTNETHQTGGFTETLFHEPIKVLKPGQVSSTGFVSNGLQMVRYNSGELVDSGNGHGLIFRRKRWQTAYWKWMSTSTPLTQRPDSNILRIYIPSTISEAPSTLERLYEICEGLELSVTMKQRFSKGVFSDEFVIWAPEYDLRSVLNAITTIQLSFLTTPPPLTYEYRGIGIADHPENGESLGMKYSDFLWGFSKGAYTTSLIEAASDSGMNVVSPWILNNRKSHSEWLEALA